MLSPELTQVLSSGRDTFNARFDQSKRTYPRLDGDSFKAFIVQVVAPLSDAVVAAAPERLSDVVQSVYDVGLALVGQGLAGPQARIPEIEAGLSRLLPPCAAFIAEQPDRVLSAFCNALHYLATAPSARPAQWVEGVEALIAQIQSVDELLAVGQVNGWRSGVAHFRSGALELASGLRPELAAALFGVSKELAWAESLQKMKDDPWFDPRSDAAPPVMWVGGFKGFGGLFSVPPKLSRSGESLLVRSGDPTWLLVVDAFGHSFHKATRAERLDSTPLSPDPQFEVVDGHVHFGGRATGVPARGELSGAISVGNTLAVSFEQSHEVAVFSSELCA